MALKWREAPRVQRWAVVGAFAGMGVGAFCVFQYAMNGTTLDRYFIMVAGLLGGGAAGWLLAKVTARG